MLLWCKAVPQWRRPVFVFQLRRWKGYSANANPTLWHSLSHVSHFFTSLFQVIIPKREDIVSVYFKLQPFASSPCLVKYGFLYTTACESLNEQSEVSGVSGKTKDPADVFRDWGCSESDISEIFKVRPRLQKMGVYILQSKLITLSRLGIKSSDLVTMIHRRPCCLSRRISAWSNERIEYMEEVFGSRDVLVKTVLENPSLLTHEHDKIKHVVEMYRSLGLSKNDLTAVILSRPTLIQRTNMDDEKINFIRRTGVPKDSKLYKYVVSLFAVSRIETIREKVMNLEKFGLSEDEILSLIGRAPMVLTLSTHKIQRNMTFVVGTMKLSAKSVLTKPFLLSSNLDTALKPRFQIACKIDEMGLVPQIKGAALLKVFRMTENRFKKVYISCHPENVAEELMKAYRNAKCTTRLADSSRKHCSGTFHF